MIEWGRCCCDSCCVGGGGADDDERLLWPFWQKLFVAGYYWWVFDYEHIGRPRYVYPIEQWYSIRRDPSDTFLSRYERTRNGYVASWWHTHIHMWGKCWVVGGHPCRALKPEQMPVPLGGTKWFPVKKFYGQWRVWLYVLQGQRRAGFGDMYIYR